MILDSGAFVAVERGNREIIAFVKREKAAGRDVVTHGGVVGQIWRGGAGKQSMAAKLLASVEIVPLDESLGKRAGALLARSGSADAVDAAVVCLANDGDDIITSDPADIKRLAQAAGVHVELVTV